MKLIIVSGRSGSGKSTALNVLEDAGYYTIDNLPASLFDALIDETLRNPLPQHDKLALCIDARNASTRLAEFPDQVARLPAGIASTLIFLDADDHCLSKRFSETRRRHPLSDETTALMEALQRENALLKPIADSADITLDTSHMLFHALREHIQHAILQQAGQGMCILIQSFGFKKGLPPNADFLFDVRCLPNPHWQGELRNLTGKDEAVIEFLDGKAMVQDMFKDLCNYLERWLPRFEHNNRPYTTVAIGCTGGQHRSVYLAERLRSHFAAHKEGVQVRHRELTAATR